MVWRDCGFKCGGGIICCIRSDIPYTTWPETNYETIWITAHPHKLLRQFATLVIGIAYHPPNSWYAKSPQCLSRSNSQRVPSCPHYPDGRLKLTADMHLKSGYSLKQIVKSAQHMVWRSWIRSSRTCMLCIMTQKSSVLLVLLITMCSMLSTPDTNWETSHSIDTQLWSKPPKGSLCQCPPDGRQNKGK